MTDSDTLTKMKKHQVRTGRSVLLLVSPEGKPATTFTAKVRVTPGKSINLVISLMLNTDLFLRSSAEGSSREKRND